MKPFWPPWQSRGTRRAQGNTRFIPPAVVDASSIAAFTESRVTDCSMAAAAILCCFCNWPLRTRPRTAHGALLTLGSDRKMLYCAFERQQAMSNNYGPVCYFGPSSPPRFFQAYAEQIRFWLDGEDEIDPPIQFPPPEYGGPIVTFSRWSEVSAMCGDSRLWGGMHFEVKRRALARERG